MGKGYYWGRNVLGGHGGGGGNPPPSPIRQAPRVLGATCDHKNVRYSLIGAFKRAQQSSREPPMQHRFERWVAPKWETFPHFFLSIGDFFETVAPDPEHRGAQMFD